MQTRVTHGDDGACENQGQFVKMMEVGRRENHNALFPLFKPQLDFQEKHFRKHGEIVLAMLA